MSELKLRARFDKPGDLQRMASNAVSWPDRDEAYLVGKRGLLALLEGESDKMVTLIRQSGPSIIARRDWRHCPRLPMCSA